MRAGFGRSFRSLVREMETILKGTVLDRSAGLDRHTSSRCARGFPGFLYQPCALRVIAGSARGDSSPSALSMRWALLALVAGSHCCVRGGRDRASQEGAAVAFHAVSGVPVHRHMSKFKLATANNSFHTEPRYIRSCGLWSRFCVEARKQAFPGRNCRFEELGPRSAVAAPHGCGGFFGFALCQWSS